MLFIVKSTAFSKALKAGRTVSSRAFLMFLFISLFYVWAVSFINYVKTDNEFWAKNYCMRVFFYNKLLKRNLDSQMAKNLDSPHILSLFSLVSYITLLANYSEIVMSKVLAKILSFAQKYVHNLSII